MGIFVWPRLLGLLVSEHILVFTEQLPSVGLVEGGGVVASVRCPRCPIQLRVLLAREAPRPLYAVLL